MRFENREQAARLLVERLRPYCENAVPLVLAIPRGAVPMAKIIAAGLGGELDVVLVHKLGHPDQPELAIGAVDESGNAFVSDWASDVDNSYVEAETQRQLAILSTRRSEYTPFRAPLDQNGRIVIVVDDGIATGSTMVAALRAVRAKNPQKLIAAVAVASVEAIHTLRDECDTVVCLHTAVDFSAVGQFFKDFTQVTDQEVIDALRGK